MGYANYTNDRRGNKPRLSGCFRNRETDHLFEYCYRTSTDPDDNLNIFPDYPNKIFLGRSGMNSFSGETRYAKVKKTVAYIVVDENADGSPVVEKWTIKGHIIYPED